MSPNDLSDDHVAEILKRDAKNSSIKYSTAGLQAFLPQRPVGHAPKPNTRFLKSIIRETDNHNAALLAKEAKDSRLRLKALQVGKAKVQRESDGGQSRNDARACHYDSRRHHPYEDRDESRRLKRRRKERDDNDDEQYSISRISNNSESRRNDGYNTQEKLRSSRHQSSRKGRSDFSEISDEDNMRSKRSHHRHRHSRRQRSLSRECRFKRRSSSHDRLYEHSEYRRKESRKNRHTSRSPSPERYKDYRQQRRKRSRRRRSMSSSPEMHHSSHKSRQTQKSHSADVSYTKGRTHLSMKTSSAESLFSPTPSEDSDPLAAFIGPAPPVTLSPSSRKKQHHQVIRSKGRGKLTTMSSSAMDNHFAPDYNPTIDVHPDSDIEEDDWDQALEALRDRQRWRQQGADRLLAAGFTPEEVQKWQKGGRGGANGEKDGEDVRWAKMGEGREWDRGKVMDVDGNVELRAEWGRLKGT